MHPEVGRPWLALPVWLTMWGGLALRLWGLGQLPPLPDEAYYWLWSRRLALAYYDHPAGTALLVRASTALGGSGPFGVRWLNALLGTACIALVWAIGGPSPRPSPGGGGGLRMGRWTAAVMVAFGAPFVVVSRFVYTDTLFLFLMLLNFLALRHLLRRVGRGRLAYVAWGLSLALLLNTKYTALLYGGGVGLWLLLRQHRLLGERRFQVATLVGAAGASPVFVWNASHGWASFRWQLAHLVSASPGGAVSGSLPAVWLANVRHAIAYLTWPLAVTAFVVAVSLLWWWARRPGCPSLRGLVAFVLVLPVLLSPAGSPRNLAGGLVFLLFTLGAIGSRGHLARLLVAVISALVALYGVGTAAALSGFATPFRSSVVSEIHRDVAGVEALADALSNAQAPIYTVDYGLAGQLAYLMGRPVYTSWGQYRIWGYPDLSELVVVGSPYLPPNLLEVQLRQAFDTVEGPYQPAERPSQDPGNLAKVRWWRVAGLRWSPERFVAGFDFLTLMEQVP